MAPNRVLQSHTRSPKCPAATRRLRLAVLCAAALAFVASDASADIRILNPRTDLDEIYHPLYLEIDFAAIPDTSSFEVLLNGVDITDDFELEQVSGRWVAVAIDVWGAGVVLPGSNTLEASVGSWSTSLDFDTVGDPHADAVAGLTLGNGGGFGQGDMPGIVLGGPQGLGLFLGSLDVLSVGQGGVIELEFVDNVVLDRPGVDFTVFENPFFTLVLGTITGDPFSEPGRVSVSQDGVVWHTYSDCETAPLDPPLHPGCAGVYPVLSDELLPGTTPHASIPTDTPIGDLIGVPQSQLVVPDGSGGDSFDLADLGLTWARFVRIEDVGPALGLPPTVGLDLDAVTAVNAAVPTDADDNGIPDAAEPVPEPGLLSGLAAGVAVLTGLTRRKRAHGAGTPQPR